LHEYAQQDYEKIVEWYASRSIKSAENFIDEVGHALQLICDNPNRWRNEYKHFRELGLKKYALRYHLFSRRRYSADNYNGFISYKPKP